MASSSSGYQNGEGPSTMPIFGLESDSEEETIAESEAAFDEASVLGSIRDNTLLDDDFLADTVPTRISFKRKLKAPSKLSLPSFLSPTPALQGRSSTAATPHLSSARIRKLREQSHKNGSDLDISTDDGFAADGNGGNDVKDGPLDWYGDGPRRRVGYDDLTAIDWIFEYTKERQRLRNLYSKAHGWLGQANQFLDASTVWIVLIATGLSVGLLAAAIDVVSDWLGDIKTGFCHSGVEGGQFYLNRGFCCWGYQEWSQCQGWTPWGVALGLSSGAGRYMVEYALFILFSVTFAISASLLVRDFAKYAKHSGIPEIKTVLGGFIIRRFMGSWTLIIKSIGLCLAVASGLWLGKEGPLVHVACCCANLLMKLSPSLNENEARKREVLSAAAAAGISVAFGSPIGGVLFSLEQLSYYFPDKTMWQSFVCAMVAAVTLQVFNPFRTGQLVLYQVTYSTGWHDFELVPFALLGVFGGVYGGLFIKLNMRIAKWRKSSPIAKHPVMEVLAAALITALINYPNHFMRAQSSELVHTLFAECSNVYDDEFGICQLSASYPSLIFSLVLAGALGFLLASVTFGLKIPAGIILPSMAIGALFGRALGMVVERFQQAYPHLLIFLHCEPDAACVTPGTYAIIGAASALGGVTRMTVSIVVIMFELTGALTYVLPIMIAVMLSKWVGDAFGRRGIYESWINFNEYPFLDNRDDTPIPDVPASQVMSKVEDLATISSTGHTLQSLNDFLVAHSFRGFPVVADHDSNTLLGYMTRSELIHAIQAASADPRNMAPSTEVFFIHNPSADHLKTVDLRPWMDQTPITLNAKGMLQLTVDMFLKLGLKYVLFVDRGALHGLLTKKDIWYVMNSIGDGTLEDFNDAPRTSGGGLGRDHFEDVRSAGLERFEIPFDQR